MSGVKWTAQEVDAVRHLYPDHTADVVARVLGRHVRSVYQKAAALGLVKSEAFKASDRSGRIKRGQKSAAMQASQFKPGQAAWNKGTNFVAGGRSAETRFKKGQMVGAAQRNYKPIGSLRVSKDGYLERKVNDTHPVPARRWVAEHRLVWEASVGPIPHGYIVVFKPRMKTAVLDLVTADRLECISRAENAKRNHPVNKSPELAKLVQLKGAITRQVNRINREAQEQRA